MVDSIALIDAARRWRAPEHRAQALRELAAELGDDLLPNSMRLVEMAGNLSLEVVMTTGITVVIPCNL